ncbi:dihydropteroate synthase [Thermogladius sp. 4427co]|uniref:dihydropteroate synthase n=1 Tax=Thermogladius sp. 4427co TaxID=3450718 RepID=UPI003F7ACFA0
MIRANIAGIPVGDGEPVRIMGVINTSPESFYKLSVKRRVDEIAETAIRFDKAGVDFIDIGGRSTAPYLNTDVPVEVEAKRVVEAIRVIVENTSVKKPISVDTTRYYVAAEALKAGARIINDVSGLREDPRLADLAREYDAPIIVVARVKTYDKKKHPIEHVIQALRESIEIALEHGVSEERIVVDPGIGFNRFSEIPWYIWDSAIIDSLDELRSLNKPILIGVSRKSFIGAITGRSDPAERLYGSLAATAIAVYRGAHIVRTHDPSETVDVVKISQFIRNVNSMLKSL